MKKHFIALASAAIIALSSAPAVFAADYGWQDVGGVKKYIMADGNCAVGNIIIDGVVYYFSPDGALVGPYTGVGRKGADLVYYRDGVIVTGGWIESPKGTYYSYTNGVLATGVVTIDGKQYTFGSGGLLKKTKNSFSVKKNKDFIMLGAMDTIEFTVTADSIAGEASFGEISELHRMKDGKWFKVQPENYGVNDIAYLLGDDKREAKLTFTPEKFSGSVGEGHYRIALPIHSSSGIITKYCEFDIIAQASIKTPKSEYNLADTTEITFSVNVNKQSQLYTPETYELYFIDDETGVLKKVEPKAAENKVSTPVTAIPGTSFSTKLDLTRYNHSAFKTGKYRAVIGDGLFCDFKLITPYEASVVQEKIDSPRKRQVMITVYNQTDSDVTLKGYGQLYRYTGKKWVKLKTKKSLDTELTVPAMHKWDKSLMLTDYYSLSDLKKGNYCIRFTDTNGYIYQAKFKLE